MRVVITGVLLSVFLAAEPVLSRTAPLTWTLLSVMIGVVLASLALGEVTAGTLVAGAGAALGYGLPVSYALAAALFVGAVFMPRASRAPVAWAAGLEVALACAAGFVVHRLTVHRHDELMWVAAGVGSLLCMVPFVVLADDAVADGMKRRALRHRDARRWLWLRGLVLRRRFVATAEGTAAERRALDALFHDLLRGGGDSAAMREVGQRLAQLGAAPVPAAVVQGPPPEAPAVTGDLA